MALSLSRRRSWLQSLVTVFRDARVHVRRVARIFVILSICMCAHATRANASPDERALPAAFDGGAQEPEVITPSRDQMVAIERWVRDYTAWKAWFAKWHNRIEPGLFGTRPRRPRPEPPSALVAACPAPLNADGVLLDACRLLEEWRNQDVASEIIKEQVTATRTQKEVEDRSVWWRHVHLDALWPMTQGTSGVFGVLGLHSTIDLTGRMEIFLAPGAILMRVPTPAGPQWKPATDWGLSCRLADFTLPGARRPATLHINIAKVWLLGEREDLPGVERDMYIAGFSLTFRKVVRH